MSGPAQLLAVGAQDEWLYSKPETTLFRSVYRRITNFATSVEPQVIQGIPQPGGMSAVRFERKGDLLNSVYLTRLDNATDSVDRLDWSTLIDRVEFYCGGQLIDTHHYEYDTIIHKELMAQTLARSNAGSQAGAGAGAAAAAGESLFYPLKFFFCESPALSLPLSALAYHDCEIRIYWTKTASFAAKTMQVWSKFVYLDKEERMQFANGMDILINQVQRNGPSPNNRLDLNLNHPVRFLASTASCFDNRNRVRLQLNGADTTEPRPAEPHYRQCAAYFDGSYGVAPVHHEGFAQVRFVMPFTVGAGSLCSHSPQGALNFSRFDSARLEVGPTGTAIDGHIYAVNANILSVKNGLGSLLYSS